LAAALAFAPAAHGYSLASPTTRGCHESITGQALRNLRATLDTAPPIEPTTDQRALLDDLPFVADDDLRDFGAVSLMLAVRDNDLKGNSPADSFDVVPINGDPALQREHCLRAPAEDEPGGSEAALADCRAFVLERTAEALDGLDARGAVDPAHLQTLGVYLPLRGPHTMVPMPLYYVKMGQALHALEDGFAHNLRTADGLRVTTVLDWAEQAERRLVESRDGPPHMTKLDQCDDPDPPRARRHALVIAAATEVLTAMLDPSLGRDEKLAAVDQTFTRYYSFQPGCSMANAWCDPAEDALRDGGCSLGGRPDGAHLVLLGAILLALVLLRRSRAREVLIALVLLSPAARADPPLTPPVEKLEKLQERKRPGSRVGFALSLSGAIDRPALAGSIGLRVRLHQRFVLGFDTEWNPWISTANDFKNGAFNAYFVGIVRYPLNWQRINLRSTVAIGASVLLFDVYGAPAGSIGVYAGTSPLGLDVDLGRALKLVIDPINLSLPVPHLTAAPFYYLQYRITVGFQFGA
jgi:hypothetical protein